MRVDREYERILRQKIAMYKHLNKELRAHLADRAPAPTSHDIFAIELGDSIVVAFPDHDDLRVKELIQLSQKLETENASLHRAHQALALQPRVIPRTDRAIARPTAAKLREKQRPPRHPGAPRLQFFNPKAPATADDLLTMDIPSTEELEALLHDSPLLSL